MTRPNLLVSIGIPIYNAERTLPDALRSVFAQTYENWELILVDDGSADHSLDIAQSVTDPRVIVLADGENKKLPARLNQIIDAAKGELICRMDADDLISPRKIEEQLRFFRDPEIQLVTTGICSLSNDGEPLGYRIPRKQKLTMRALLRGHGLAHAPVLGRKSWFVQNRYDVSVPRAEDAALWCTAHLNGNLRPENFHVIEKPLYFFREHHGDLRRILVSHHDLRVLIRRHGPESLGYLATLSELARSYIRSTLFRISLFTGTVGRIIHRRNQPKADPNILEEVRRDIGRIRSTIVPGMSTDGET